MGGQRTQSAPARLCRTLRYPGEAPKQSILALMRKLLHLIWGSRTSGRPFVSDMGLTRGG